VEAMAAEKFLRLVFRTISEKRNAGEIFCASELDRVLEQHLPIAVALILFMDDKVLKQNHKAAFRGTNGEKQIDHADDDAVAAEDEYPTAARLFENQSKTAELFVFVGAKITFLGEKVAEHLGQLVQISFGSRLNDDFLAHRLHCLFQKLRTLATCESKLDIVALLELTIPCSILR
jgi:hypothetical protein